MKKLIGLALGALLALAAFDGTAKAEEPCAEGGQVYAPAPIAPVGSRFASDEYGYHRRFAPAPRRFIRMQKFRYGRLQYRHFERRGR